MPAPAYVQETSLVTMSSQTLTFTLNGVTNGNTILAALFQSVGTRTYSGADNAAGGSNTYTSAVSLQGATGTRERYVQIFYAKNVVGGNLTIEITQAGGAAIETYGYALEIGPIDGTNPVDKTGTCDLTTDVATTLYSAASGEIDAAANTFILSAIVTSGNAGTTTQPTDFTKVGTNTSCLLARYETATARDNERGAWGITTARFGVGVIASFNASLTVPTYDLSANLIEPNGGGGIPG